MKYKHLKVDMDYSADPIWGGVSEDRLIFANCSLSEFEPILSKELLHGLEVYRNMWDTAHWSEFMTPSMSFEWPGEELVHDCLKEIQIHLAARLKEELPDAHVYYCQRDSSGKWTHVEISNLKPVGIYTTFVG